jgi:uncharacterized protein (DUF3820 family)
MDKFEMKFGKYKGEKINKVFEIDKQYISWLIKNIDKDKNKELIKNLTLLIEEDEKNTENKKLDGTKPLHLNQQRF